NNVNVLVIREYLIHLLEECRLPPVIILKYRNISSIWIGKCKIEISRSPAPFNWQKKRNSLIGKTCNYICYFAIVRIVVNYFNRNFPVSLSLHACYGAH